MIHIEKQGIGALVQWTYSREEWRTFIRWKKKKKGIVYYLLHRLNPGRGPKSPCVTITPVNICINENNTAFHGEHHQIKNINIRDAGRMNVMEICYVSNLAQSSRISEIHIPVPKGKLKEAIGLEEKLNLLKNC